MVMDGTKVLRRFVGIVLPAVVVGLGVAPWIVLGHDLPHRVASHFDWRGHADASLPLPVAVVVHGAIAVVCAGLLVAWARSASSDRGNRWVGPVAVFNGVLFGVLSLAIALGNEGHADWHDVRLEPGAVGGAIGAAFGIAFALAATTALQQADPTATYPSLPLAERERAAWFGRASSRALGALGVIMVLSATVLVLAGLFGAALGVGAGGLAVVGASSLDVAIGDRGMVVSSGPLHWPSVRFPLDDVVSAGAIDFRPIAWGGWGYRGSVRLLRRAAWGLRAGPAIELELRGGRRFAVTVDHAEDGAAVLNGLLAHRPLY